jgi:hypothetical protein
MAEKGEAPAGTGALGSIFDLRQHPEAYHKPETDEQGSATIDLRSVVGSRIRAAEDVARYALEGRVDHDDALHAVVRHMHAASELVDGLV